MAGRCLGGAAVALAMASAGGARAATLGADLTGEERLAEFAKVAPGWHHRDLATAGLAVGRGDTA